jgi:hypothetical protein
MSKVAHAYTDDKEGAVLPREAPDGQVNDSSYMTKKNEPIPVQDDSAPVEDPIRPEKADSDEQLGKHRFPHMHMHPLVNTLMVQGCYAHCVLGCVLTYKYLQNRTRKRLSTSRISSRSVLEALRQRARTRNRRMSRTWLSEELLAVRSSMCQIESSLSWFERLTGRR